MPKNHCHVACDESPAGIARAATSHIASVGRSNTKPVSTAAFREPIAPCPSPPPKTFAGTDAPRNSCHETPACGIRFAAVAVTVAFRFVRSVYCPTVTS